MSTCTNVPTATGSEGESGTTQRGVTSAPWLLEGARGDSLRRKRKAALRAAARASSMLAKKGARRAGSTDDPQPNASSSSSSSSSASMLLPPSLLPSFFSSTSPFLPATPPPCSNPPNPSDTPLPPPPLFSFAAESSCPPFAFAPNPKLMAFAGFLLRVPFEPTAFAFAALCFTAASRLNFFTAECSFFTPLAPRSDSMPSNADTRSTHSSNTAK
mmetsp:Transcript_22661/g.44909  ORF Transcript_22661/g.44909 Transcript_22661/m.44909 type:complete len:215 (+) Transcript_22661:550-1194(+)